MAVVDDITFSQRLILTAWESLNENAVEENAYDVKRALDVLMLQSKTFHRGDLGGSVIEANVAVNKMPITQVIPEGTEYDLRNIEPFRGAKWPFWTVTSPLPFTLEQVSENVGRAKLMDTVERLVRVANTDHMDLLDLKFFRGLGTASNDLESLNTIVGTADFGGLSATTFPGWNGSVITASTPFTFDILDSGITSATFSGNQGIRYLMSGPTLFNRAKFKGLAVTNIYQPSDSSTPNTGPAGAQVLEYLGTTWLWDRRVPDVGNFLSAQGFTDTTNYLYGIDDSTLQFGTVKNYWKNGKKIKDAPFENAYHMLINTRCNFAATSRRTHFKYTTVTTA